MIVEWVVFSCCCVTQTFGFSSLCFLRSIHKPRLKRYSKKFIEKAHVFLGHADDDLAGGIEGRLCLGLDRDWVSSAAGMPRDSTALIVFLNDLR